jgi:uncharacterized protein with GYD domain
MPVYVTLFKFTEQGIRVVKDNKKNQEESIKRVEKMGAKILGVYMTMGEYDIVAVGEAPSDEAAVAASLAASSDGNVRATTLRAFTPKEFEEIVSKLP